VAVAALQVGRGECTLQLCLLKTCTGPDKKRQNHHYPAKHFPTETNVSDEATWNQGFPSIAGECVNALKF